MAKLFDASAESRLGICCQFICIKEDYTLEYRPLSVVYIHFSKEFQFVSNKTYPLPMGTVYIHNIVICLFLCGIYLIY